LQDPDEGLRLDAPFLATITRDERPWRGGEFKPLIRDEWSDGWRSAEVEKLPDPIKTVVSVCMHPPVRAMNYG
jgi:hypothetical protein